jgi:hypothetical protein
MLIPEGRGPVRGIGEVPERESAREVWRLKVLASIARRK